MHGPSSGATPPTAAWIERADRLILAAAAALTAVFFGCVVLQVLVRYAFEYPLPWTDEIARYAFVWSSFLAAAALLGRNEHFALDFLVDALPSGPRRAARLVGTLCCLVFALVLVVYGSRWCWRLLGARTAVLELSQGGVYAVVPLSAAYMALRMGGRLLRLGRNAGGEA